ncbi:type II secretion system protein GspM [Sphingosinicella sp.]|uniref:type II secretion system protein GspM n=1 Tax=Sphingosinicella sp. TaxID=1917971 RepID=UPI00403827D5
MNGLSAWWATRSAREQRLLAVMFGLIALVLIWLLVIRPLGDAFDRAKQRHNAAVLALAEARVRTNPGGTRTAGPPPLPLDALVTRTAADAGFTAARVAGGGPATARVTLDAARPQALFGWIARLEAQGVTVERLQARANPDRTVAVEAAFSARGAR